jgi:hypothetical protein
MPPKDKPRESTRTPQCPSLPPEIWINIFRFHTSLTHLWTTCRRISTTLRACVERAFIEYFLREIHVEFYLDKHNIGRVKFKERREVSVTFDRVGTGEANKLAWFSDKSAPPAATTTKTALPRRLSCSTETAHSKHMQRWEEKVHTSKPELPNYTICIGSLVNDTALPGLDVDVKSHAINFEWRRALDLFFREETHLETLTARWHADRACAAAANKARRAAGNPPLPTPPQQSFSAALVEMRRVTRRARLREAYTHDEEMQWAIASLRYFPTAPAKGASLLPDLPGAGIGGRWFGSVNRAQELFLDEVDCWNRIETRLGRVGKGG